MKARIYGTGLVSYNIVRHLPSGKIDATVIDQSPNFIKRISDQLDMQGVVDFASHPSAVLKIL
jgi:trk system potassium uptake protein TrkA